VLILFSSLQAIQAAHDAVAQEGQCRVNASTHPSQVAWVLCPHWNICRSFLLECSKLQMLPTQGYLVPENSTQVMFWLDLSPKMALQKSIGS
jgi:hypothetical protein